MAIDKKKAEVGNRIQLRRQQLSMAAGGVASAMGVSRMAISLWEKGETALSAENLMKLSEVLRCDPVWLMTGNENSYTDTPIATSKTETEDIEILRLINLLPSSEKEKITKELQLKVKHYDDLYLELRAARKQLEK